jgi:carbamoyltransferase
MEKKSIILGISCFYHDAAAALLIDGVVVAAAQEERFTRKKHDADFPTEAIKFCLREKGVSVSDVDAIVFYDKPILKFMRLLETYIKVWPKGLRSFLMAMKVWLRDKLWIENIIRKNLNYGGKIYFTEHHYAHAAGSYYASNFSDATIVTMDGVGEWDTTTIGFGKENKIKLEKTIHFPHSLGLLYSALTYYLGFKVNSAEYKVMGLAPYGNPNKYYEHFKKLIDVKGDGSYELEMSYFAYEYGLVMTSKKFNALFGALPRKGESPLEQKHKDIAAALQKITDEIVLKTVSHAKKLYPSKNLCLSGGVALNCVANGKILQERIFENIFIQPAAGDAGGAVGAAAYFYYHILGNKKKEAMPTTYLGPSFSNDDIKNFLEKGGKDLYKGEIAYEFLEDSALFEKTALLLSQNNVVGWFQGKMEFGPRALGNRSILADPRHKENWQRVNLKIKFRESFRPFAPAVLLEHTEEYFNLKGKRSPHMLLVSGVLKDTIPAVTHVDKSARIQTVSKEENKRFHSLLSEFYKKTGCPVLINTSFNVRGEPIVATPKDALLSFINTDLDYLVLGNYIIGKRGNEAVFAGVRNIQKYLEKFELD